MELSRLEQKKRFVGRQIFELQPTGDLNVRRVTRASASEIIIPLAGFHLEPLRQQKFHWMPLLAVVPLLFLILVLGFALAIYKPSPGTSPIGLIFFMVALSGLVVPFALKIAAGSFDVVTFISSNGSRIALWNKNPTAEQFNAFLQTLKNAIQRANLAAPIPMASMTAELQKLKQLFDEGAISAEQFEAAKNKIVGLDKQGRIGF